MILLKLSEHFDKAEFTCKCGCGRTEVSLTLVEVLEAMRKRCGKPLIINSGFRCPQHNANVGGTKYSYHLLGEAADVQAPEGFSPEELARVAEEAGADGIGVYEWGVHIDVRGYSARW